MKIFRVKYTSRITMYGSKLFIFTRPDLALDSLYEVFDLLVYVVVFKIWIILVERRITITLYSR